MSKFLPDAAIASFDSDVKLAYQTGSKLRRSIRVRTNVVGSTHRFPKMGKGIATRRTSQSDVQLMNVTHTNATATLTDWNAPELTDLFDDIKNNFSEIAELAITEAQAMGRREDQLILDALDAASTTLTVADTVGDTTDLDTAKIRRAKFLWTTKVFQEATEPSFCLRGALSKCSVTQTRLPLIRMPSRRFSKVRLCTGSASTSL